MFLFWMLPPPLRVLAGSVAVPVVGAAPAPGSYKNFWKIRGRAPWPSIRSSSCHHLHQMNRLIITLITDIVFVGKGASQLVMDGHGWLWVEAAPAPLSQAENINLKASFTLLSGRPTNQRTLPEPKMQQFPCLKLTDPADPHDFLAPSHLAHAIVLFAPRRPQPKNQYIVV